MCCIDFVCRFNKLTDRFFKNSPWPTADAIAATVDGGKSKRLTYFHKCSHLLMEKDLANPGVVVKLGVFSPSVRSDCSLFPI